MTATTTVGLWLPLDESWGSGQTDDKSLDKAVRKQLQIEHAPHASSRAKLVKLADKTCNLRDIATTPPADWSEDRSREYFDWAKKVVAGVRGANEALEAAFDRAFATQSAASLVPDV